MVEISLSGSGEGPGWETPRPTLQRYFAGHALRAARLRSAPDQGRGQRCAAPAGAGHAPQDGVWEDRQG